MGKFRNSLLLYQPSLSVWTARVKDKDESVKVNKNAGATEGAANVNKALLPENAELLAVQKWATSFRTWVYANTLPWDDRGGRIARVEKHLDFMTEAGDRIRTGYDLVEAFINNYTSAIEAAKFRLNGMFKPGDYPTEDQVRRKFVFGIECMTVPDHADFRVIEGLPAEEVERLVEDGAAAIQHRVDGAMDELRDRLYDVVDKYATTLQAYEAKEVKKFNDTLSTNVSSLAALVPSLNLTGDRKLDELAKAATRLATYDLKDLRTMPEVRGAAIREALVVRAKFGREEIGRSLQALQAERKALADAGHAVSGGVDPVSLASGW